MSRLRPGALRYQPGTLTNRTSNVEDRLLLCTWPSSARHGENYLPSMSGHLLHSQHGHFITRTGLPARTTSTVCSTCSSTRILPVPLAIGSHHGHDAHVTIAVLDNTLPVLLKYTVLCVRTKHTLRRGTRQATSRTLHRFGLVLSGATRTTQMLLPLTNGHYRSTGLTLHRRIAHHPFIHSAGLI